MSSSEHPDRTSAPPLAMEVPSRGSLKSTIQEELTALTRYVPASWLGMTGYLVTGVFLGIVLIIALTLGRGSNDPIASAGVVTDNVQRLHARDIGDTCWRGVAKDAARLTVSMEVGVDGKVRSAVASGESDTMRGCVESVVRSWEFLPQAQPQAMVLPFEIDRR